MAENNTLFVTTEYNAYNSTNESDTAAREKVQFLYKYYIPPMLLFCAASIFINIRILFSVYWIRKPLSPTLHISLSLAAADACTSAFLGIGLLLNSYLPVVYDYYTACVLLLVLEMFRLSGILITVAHLLALSINHYLGILKPLHYVSIMTPKKTTIVVATLWIIPLVFITSYFLIAAEYDFWSSGCAQHSFLGEFKFRCVFATLFFAPLNVMIFCYTHILIIVRKHQRVWSKLSRSGSKRCRGIRSSRHSVNKQQKQMEGNVKAIYTTLLILGSCVVGWLPALINYLLVCKSDCYFSGKYLSQLQNDVYETIFFVNWSTNVLIILKTLANPIIYSARMIEIKEGTRKMHTSMTELWCAGKCSYKDDAFRTCNQNARGLTALCKSNGNVTHQSIGRSEIANTLL